MGRGGGVCRSLNDSFSSVCYMDIVAVMNDLTGLDKAVFLSGPSIQRRSMICEVRNKDAQLDVSINAVVVRLTCDPLINAILDKCFNSSSLLTIESQL